MLFENKIQSKNALFTVMAAFLFSYFLFNDLGIRYIFGYIVLGIILLILAWKSKFRVYFSSLKMLFLVMVGATTVFSLLPNSNFNHLIISLTISMLMFTGYYVFMSPGIKAIKRFTICLHAVSLFFSFYLLFVKIFPEFYWSHIYVHLGPYSKQFATEFMPQGYGVTIGGSTTYAPYLIFIALAFNAAYILRTNERKTFKSKVFSYISSTIYFGAIMVTNRRSEAIAMVVTLFLMFLFSLNLKHKKELLKKFLVGFTAILVMISVVFALASFGFLERYENVLGFISQNVETPEEPSFSESEPSIDTEPEPEKEHVPKEEITTNEVSSGRTDLWRKAYSLFRENPITGIGWEQFMNHNTYEHDVHNTYLQWLCEAGIIGFILLAVPMFLICFIIFKQTLRFTNSDKVSDTAKLLNHVAISMQAFYLFVNLIDPAYYHLNFFCFYTLSLIFAETANKLEFIDTGVETDCLRRKFLPKILKLKIFY